MEILKKFYAVTISSSLYEAVIDGEGKIPRLTKLDLRGESKVPAGKVLASGGTILGITKQLILFIPEGCGMISPASVYERQPSLVNTQYWTHNTSNIVALFLEEKDARACQELSEAWSKEHEKQWRESTIAVLRAIGNEHPQCSIETHFGQLCLIPPEEWQEKN